MGLITEQYEKLIDLNQKLKLLKSFVAINAEAISTSPQILSRFNLYFKNIAIKFSAGENKTINLIVCDKDDFILHVVNDIRSIEHFYYEGNLMLKVQNYENWHATQILSSKTGMLKRLAMPVQITRKTAPKHSEDTISIIKNAKINVSIQNRNLLQASVKADSRFNKLFEQ